MNAQEIILDLQFSRYGTTRVAEQVLCHLNEENRSEVMRALELLTSSGWPDAEAPFRTLVLESLDEWLAYCEALPVFDRFRATITTLRVLGLPQPNVSELAKKAAKELRRRRIEALQEHALD
ncbi:hypothetical protein FY150_19745 [Agrobacterium tumefaciens]|nr:hypothetical protein FY150_19745 [Agrobacterium tumefaciens]